MTKRRQRQLGYVIVGSVILTYLGWAITVMGWAWFMEFMSTLIFIVAGGTLLIAGLFLINTPEDKDENTPSK